jgi:formylglycine-generating enzyme required for sulfatase activity
MLAGFACLLVVVIIIAVLRPAPEPVGGAAKVPVVNSVGMEFVQIQPGVFQMGSPENEPGHYGNETQHKVRITKPYSLQTTEVTQAQYQRVMGSNPSFFKGDDLPVEEVYWEDANTFCKKLSELPEEKAAGRVYRLPTEAEWEYACRAGGTEAYSFGGAVASLGNYCWYHGNSGGKTHPVGQKKPNAWGLYDMHGNVWEWCADWYAVNTTGEEADPSGPASGSGRVGRGGSWSDDAGDCRSADRNRRSPGFRYYFLGFRVALVSSGK